MAIESLKQNTDRRDVYFFYCRRDKVCPVEIAREFLWQACRPFISTEKTTPSAIHSLLESSSLEDYLIVIQKTFYIKRTPVVVIDGLDETPNDHWEGILKLLQGLRRSSWKVFLTSRNKEERLTQALEDCFELQIRSTSVEDDIKLFVQRHLERSYIDEILQRSKCLQREYIVEYLSEKAAGK